PGHSIEPGRKDDNVEFILFAACANPRLRYFLDVTICGGIDEEYIALVERLVIVGIEWLTFGTIRIALRRQFFRRGCIQNGGSNFSFDVIRADLIGFFAEKHVLIISQPKCEAALVPHSVKFLLPLLRRYLQSRFGDEAVLKAKKRLPYTLDDFFVIALA